MMIRLLVGMHPFRSRNVVLIDPTTTTSWLSPLRPCQRIRIHRPFRLTMRDAHARRVQERDESTRMLY